MLVRFSAQKIQAASEDLYQRWFPKVGLSLDWAGLACCVKLTPQGLCIGIDEAPKSKLNRLKFLPRSSFEVQISSFKLLGKATPSTEVLFNLNKKTFSSSQLDQVLEAQQKETRTADQIWARLQKTRLTRTSKPALTA